MSTYPTLKNQAELLKITTKDDEFKTLKYKTEKHDYENILKSLKVENDYYKKKHNSLNKEKIYILQYLEFLTGSYVELLWVLAFNSYRCGSYYRSSNCRCFCIL